MDIEKYNAVIVARQIASCDKLSLEEKAEALDELKWEVRNNCTFTIDSDVVSLSSMFTWLYARKGHDYWSEIYGKLN